MKAKKYSLLVVALLSVVGPARGQTRSAIADSDGSQSSPHVADSLAPTPRYPRYILQPSDVLELTFPISPEFDQTISIQPDGYVTLRGIGDLYVQGKTVPELTTALQTAYGTFLHDPVIDVELKDFEKPYFVAGGELGHPGKYELRGDTTVAEAIQIAGGFTDRSKHSQVLVFRRVPNGWEQATRIDVKQMMANRSLAEDMTLRPGDLIFVPKNKLSEVRSFIPSTGLGFGLP